MRTNTDLNNDTDDQAIIEAGYKPQLRRSLGFFSSFAVTFSTVSVLMGIFSNFGYVLTKAGPFGFWTWPVVGCGQLLVALVFAELAGRLPLTGAIYNWNSRLAHPAVGWLTAWMLFLAYGIGAVGTIVAMLAPLQSLVGQEFSPRLLGIVGCAIILSHTLINIWGVNLASRINKLAVIAEIIALIVFGLVLLGVVLLHHEANVTLLTTIPATPTPYLPGFLLASLLAAWTIIGFELPSDLSEETINVKQVAPKSIVSAVLISIVLGCFFLGTLTLAIPDLGTVTAASDPISSIVASHLGETAMKIFLIFVLIAIYALAMLVMAAAARILFAVARDQRVVGSTLVTKISTHKVPVVAILVVTAIEIVTFLMAQNAVDLYAAVSVLFFGAYLITVISFAFGFKNLPPSDSFSLKTWRWPVVVTAILWLIAMVAILTLPEEFHNAAKIAGGVFVAGLAILLLGGRKLKI